MAIEDPDLVVSSRKADRRRSRTEDVMRTLTKLDRVTGKLSDLAQAARRLERRAHRQLHTLHTRRMARA